jgi:hypothetical protein
MQPDEFDSSHKVRAQQTYVQGDNSTGHFEQDTQTSRSRILTLMFAMNREATSSGSPSKQGSQFLWMLLIQCWLIFPLFFC